MYGQNAIVINEFLGKSWRHVLPNSTELLGVEVLKSRGFFNQSYWYWICFGALIGYMLLFNFGYILALAYLNPIEKHQVVKSEQSLSDEENRGSTLAGSLSMGQPDRKRGMVLPFEPNSITFDEVTYSVDMSQRLGVEILISGFVFGKEEFIMPS